MKTNVCLEFNVCFDKNNFAKTRLSRSIACVKIVYAKLKLDK